MHPPLYSHIPYFMISNQHNYIVFWCLNPDFSVIILQDDLDAPPERICGAEVPMPYAANLEALALPTVADIVRVTKRMLNKQ